MQKKQTLTLQAIADAIEATLHGDPNCEITGVATLEQADVGDISFLSKKQYRKYLPGTKASAVILSAEDEKDCETNALICKDPRLGLARVVQMFKPDVVITPGVDDTAIIGQNCDLPESVFIGPHVVIGDGVRLGEGVVLGAGSVIGDNCQIEDNTHLNPRVTLYANVRIGKNCLLHSGVVVGSDGFGFANEAGQWVKLQHLGGVVIGNQVEIGSNTTIDRGFLEDTEIGDGVIIDNLVQIGHNVMIGKNTAIAGCVAIAGSAQIGEYCMIGGGACIGGHLTIVNQVYITAMSGVNHSLNTPGIYSSGFPAKPAESWRKNAARFNFLNSMFKRLHALESKVGELELNLEESE